MAHTAAALKRSRPTAGYPTTAADAAGADRDLLQHLGALRDERGTQEEVLGRVPGDRELGERDEVGAGALGLFVRVEDARRVAVEVTDHEVELRGRHSEPGHTARIRDTARMSAGETVLASTDLAAAVDRSADAPTARTVLARVIEAHPETADELVDDALVRDGMVALACASRSLSSAVVADAALLDPLRDPAQFARARRRGLPNELARAEPHRRARPPVVETSRAAPHRDA